MKNDTNHINLVSQHLDHLEKVKKSIIDLPVNLTNDIDQILFSIKTIKEDIKTAKLDDLPGLFDLLHLNHTLLERVTKKNKLPDPSCPYFGHMKIKESGKLRDYYLGHISFISAKDDIRIIDWREAPIAQVFFNYAEGDEFEFEVPGRTITGELVEKNILSIRDGKLLRIDKSSYSIIFTENYWEKIETQIAALEGGQGVATRDVRLGTGQTGFVTPQISALLDKEQFSILKKDDFRPLLLIGGAGCGKTTVAIHRLAFLCRSKGYDPKSIIVVVPHKGLITLIKKLLSDIHLEKIKVLSVFELMKMHARNLIQLPTEVSKEPPHLVKLFKRSPQIKLLIEDFYNNKIYDLKSKVSNEIITDLDLHANGNFKEVIEALFTIKDRLSLSVRLIVEQEKENLYNFLDDRNQCLSDKVALARFISTSNIPFADRMISELTFHTIKQIKNLDHDHFDAIDVEKDLLNSIPDQDLSLIDEEDYPLFLFMLKTKCGEMKTSRGELRKVQHLVLDETQEFSKVELNILGTMINKECVTIAGDAAQQIDEMQNFESWEQVLQDLNLPKVDANELFVTYRSPKTIMEFALKVLGTEIKNFRPKYTKIGKVVGVTQVQQRAHASILISESLNKLLTEEPRASVAIIANTTENAKNFYKELGDLGQVRLVLDGDFSFRPGVDITTVELVKGLEFDYVIIPDADSINYPDRPLQRRRMHLAATRAIHQLWVITNENKSPILDFVQI